MANVILTQSGAVTLPLPEETRMPDVPGWPRILYHPTEPSRIFESQEDLDAAGPGWVLTPDEAAEAAAHPPAPPSPEPPPADEGSPPPRSRR